MAYLKRQVKLLSEQVHNQQNKISELRGRLGPATPVSWVGNHSWGSGGASSHHVSWTPRKCAFFFVQSPLIWVSGDYAKWRFIARLRVRQKWTTWPRYSILRLDTYWKVSSINFAAREIVHEDNRACTRDEIISSRLSPSFVAMATNADQRSHTEM